MRQPVYRSLFLLNVFQTVKCYCYEDDDTGEYELKVRIDTKDRKRIGQSGEDKNTNYHT